MLVSKDNLAVNQTIPGWASHAAYLRAAAYGHPIPTVRTLLRKTFDALAEGRYAEALQFARKASAIDPGSGLAWRLIGLAHEGEGASSASLDAYTQAYAVDPSDHDLLSDLGRLALTLGMSAAAAEFYSKALAVDPWSTHLAAQLSTALSDDDQYAKAVTVLRDAIRADIDNAALWNALAAVLLQQGETRSALIFAEHAVTLSGGAAEPIFNQSIAKLDLGDLKGAIADCDTILPRADKDRKPAILFVRAKAKLANGDFTGGWSDYRARLNPRFPTAPIYLCLGAPWKISDDLRGKKLLVVGEQGIGDEIMLANLIPDILKAVGDKGSLFVAVEPRLVTLFSRSFPAAAVCAHRTSVSLEGRPTVEVPNAQQIDFWAPLGALTRLFRSDLNSFNVGGQLLKPDWRSTARWRSILDETTPNLKVGIAWKSMKMAGRRSKYYPPFEAWDALLRTPGVQFINLQYGDCSRELEDCKSEGKKIWTDPDLDLTQNIDGAASLSAAVDLMIGVGNASTNLAAAVGVPTWFIAQKAAWPMLGTERCPWFGDTRVFFTDEPRDWLPVFAKLEKALEDFRAEPRPQR